MTPAASITLDAVLAHARHTMNGWAPGDYPARENTLIDMLIAVLGYDPSNPDARAAVRDALFTPTEIGTAP